MVTIYVNIDDPIQVDALFDTMTLVRVGWLTPADAALMVQQTRSDEAIEREIRETQREYSREGREGWL